MHCFNSATSFILYFLPMAFVGLISTEAMALQPPQKVEALRRQLQAMQSQLAELDDSNPFGDDGLSNKRVKAVGSHRSRKPVPVVDKDDLLIRLYDLSDVFVVSPNYPAQAPNELAGGNSIFPAGRRRMQSGSGGGGFGGGGLGGGGGGGVFRLAPAAISMTTGYQEATPGGLQSAQVSLDQMVTAIKQTVSPDRWGDVDEEDVAKIQFLGNTLLITATNDMHTQINNLLNLFRSHWGKLRTVSIQTYWVRADEGEAKSLLTGEHQEAIGAGVVDDERWKEFIAAAESEKRLAFSATLTGHNNQTLYTLSGRQRQLIVGAIPIESRTVTEEPIDDGDEVRKSRSTHTVGFQPVRQTVHDGAAIQVTPLATRGGNFVVVDLHAKVNEFIKPEEGSVLPSTFAQTESGEKLEVKFDSTDYIGYRLSTTVRCPKEKIVLAGSMTFDSSSAVEQPNLYLFIRATVHTIKEDKSDWTAEPTDQK